MLHGVQGVVDALKPGIVASFTFGTKGGTETIWMSGHRLGFGVGVGSVSVECEWSLPSTILVPGEEYSLRLLGGTLEVSNYG